MLTFRWIIRVGKDLLSICDDGERLKISVLTAMMVMGAAMEVVGIGVVIPFVGLLGDSDLLHDNKWLSFIGSGLGIRTVHGVLAVLGGGLFIIILVKNLHQLLLAYLQSKFIFEKQAGLASELLRVYLQRPYNFHLQRDSSVLLRNIMTEAFNATNCIMLQYLSLVAEVCVVAAIVVFLLLLKPIVAISVFGLLSMLGYGIFTLLSSTLKAQGEERKKRHGDLIRWTNQGLGGIKEAKLFQKTKYFLDGFIDSSHHYARSATIFGTLSVVPRLAIETIAVFSMLLLVVVVIISDDGASNVLGTVTIFAIASVRLMPTINRITVTLNTIRFYSPSLDVVIDELRDQKIVDEEQECFEFKDSINMKDVSYRYPASDVDVVKNVSLKIKKGEAVGFAGLSGSGKSTIVDLILGLIEPTCGSVTIDRSGLKASSQSWQRNIGYVPQQAFLLDGTLRQNIAFGVPELEVSDKRVRAVIKMAKLDDKLRGLPHGLDSRIGENGIRMSGGERQRIAIARALYHDPDVIVFDEATAALDNETESEIAQTIKPLIGVKTIIMVAHRLSTIKDCDSIYVMEKGVVVESGTYNELVERKGLFRSLMSSQVV